MYKVILTKQAQKGLAKAPRHVREACERALAGLATEPRPFGCKKLQAAVDTYRIRVGQWRIIYTVEDGQTRGVEILRVRPRGAAY